MREIKFRYVFRNIDTGKAPDISWGDCFTMIRKMYIELKKSHPEFKNV